MCQSIAKLTPTNAVSAPFDVKDDVQMDSSFTANVNPTSVDIAGRFRKDSFRTFSIALPTPFAIEEATQVEMGFQYPIMSFFDLVPTITMAPGGVPGVKCPTCESVGVESWVIRGKVCSKCGTPCQ